MITAEWLFKNHARHLALVSLLYNEISYESDMETMQKNHDMDIEGLALGRLPLDGLPHTPTYNSATEQIMLKLEDSAIREQSDRQWQLLQYRRYIQMYDSLITILTPKERWFVDMYYIQKHTIVSISEQKGSPFEGCVRSTIWRFKQRLLKRADELLLSI